MFVITLFTIAERLKKTKTKNKENSSIHKQVNGEIECGLSTMKSAFKCWYYDMGEPSRYVTKWNKPGTKRKTLSAYNYLSYLKQANP